MNTEHILTIKLTFRAPLLIKGTNPAAFGVDTPFAREAFGDKPCIYGTLLKGKIAEALAQIARTLADNQQKDENDLLGFATEWLGYENEIQENGGGSNDPYRGWLLFDDLLAVTAHRKNIRHRIAVDDELGSVEEKMLQVMEQPFAPGEEVVFQGNVRFFGDDEQLAKVTKKLQLGLSWLTQVGAQRTIGFGRLTKVEITPAPGRRVMSSLSADTAPLALDLVIRPRGPLCISQHRIGGNLFESADIIPGNVLAGALAETWAALVGKRLTNGVSGLGDRAELAKHFNEIRFTHAFPTTQTSPRPQVVPFSVVNYTVSHNRTKTTHYRDISEYQTPIVFNTPNGQQAPAFQVDWKDDINSLFGWVKPARELRVRTAIASKKRRANRGDDSGEPEPEGKLFAWEMVHPRAKKENSKELQPIVWLSRIDLSAITDDDTRAQVARQLTELLSVLSFVSKTKAACDVDVTPLTKTDAETGTLTDGGKYALVLQTPALLCDPRFQNVNGVSKHGVLTKEELHALYADTWKEISDDSLQLSHFFARQSLAGGEYLYHRFLKRRGRPYNPWLLTDAGSVFVFTVKDKVKAKEKIETWLTKGLDLPTWAKTAWGDKWNENPFLPANGFGEIRPHRPHSCTPPPQPDEIQTLEWDY